MCQIEKQIAKHCDDSETKVCPDDSSVLVEQSNRYGTWFTCTECEYETEIM